ncbi:nucleotidyltransferase domain-containing protein [Candidatus Woesearchaeota archaeon]|nr:nucleotidyltransferase domain-containing protein [Candidatus Woesearchaeota archaeon]
MRLLNRQIILAYCYAYISYLFREPEIKQQIKKIYLFGSCTRGDFDKESDVDIFIETDKKNELLIKKISVHALKKFNSIEQNKWELRGIANKFSLKIGDLLEWELKNSIDKEGIALYSKTSATNLQKYLLFQFNPIQKISKRVKIIRTLFGRKEINYNDNGMIDAFEGKRISPTVFIVKEEGLQEITEFLAEEKVIFSFEEIWK